MQTKLFPTTALLLTFSLAVHAQTPATDVFSPEVRELFAQAAQQQGQPGQQGQQGQQFGGQRVLEPQDGAPVVDIFALIDRLAVEMGKEFILDPRMRGQSGLSTARADADYDSLLAMLRTNGFAAIEVGDQIRIVPEQVARAEPSPVISEDDSRISDHAVVTRVIDISGIRFADVSGENGEPVSAAGYLIPVLRPLMSTSIGNIVTIPGSNKVIIVDRYDNVRRITAIVDELRQ